MGTGGAIPREFMLDSTFKLLRSNCAPSPSQEQNILETIANAKTRLSSLDAEMQRLRSFVEALEREQENIQNYIACQESLLSPIRRLPPEVLGQIFLTLRDISEPACFGDEGTQNVHLWTLLRVCKFWREVASSYSELWASFDVIVQPFGRPSDSDHTKVCRRIMQLAKDCILYSHLKPLHFTFHANKDFLEVAELLAAACHRWGSVSFEDFNVVKFLTPRIQGRLPKLSTLALEAMGMEWDSHDEPIRTFSEAPSLTCLILTEFRRPQERFVFPYHQITHFTSFGLREFIPILRLMPSLVEYESIVDFCDSVEIQGRVLLPNLQRLKVVSNSPITTQIFDSLQVPNLTSVTLISKRGFSRIYANSVIRMVRASRCCVKRLSITDYAVDSVLQIANEVRDLEVLEVINIMYPGDLLAGLTTTLPNLQNLVLKKCGLDLHLTNHLLNLVRTRLENPSSPTATPGESRTITNIEVGLISAPPSKFLARWSDCAILLQKLGVHIRLVSAT